ncbi:MAG: hypothetical protein Q4A96_02800 [Candidatus Saccharibacteria bacterium]|nr:hypothetical protein [Candidatus Saccharibacteria bacterium]
MTISFFLASRRCCSHFQLKNIHESDDCGFGRQVDVRILCELREFCTEQLIEINRVSPLDFVASFCDARCCVAD